MSRLTLFCALLITGCAASDPLEIPADEVSGKADGLPTKLKLKDDHRMDLDEPSDLAFFDGTLYAVSDKHSKIYELDNDGDVQDVIDVEAQDLEALAVDDDGHFWIGDEADKKIWRVNSDGERKESIDVDVDDGSSGIEGLAFDDDGDILVGTEKNPVKLIKLDAGSGDQKKDKTLDFADDLSAVSFNPDDGHIYVLSDEEHKLFRLDSDFDKITSWKLPIEHPEGLAFDGDTVYIASDSEERLYVFELD